MHRLIFTDPAFAGQTCALPQGVITLGRSRGNDLIVLDESVSGQHCQLLVSWTDVIVRDGGSRNGTFVNQVRVQGQTGVYSGQQLRFGAVEAVLQLDLPALLKGSEMTACHADCRGTEWPAASSTAMPRKPAVITPCRVSLLQSRAGVSPGTLLVGCSAADSSDPSQMPSRGTARYWRRAVQLLAEDCGSQAKDSERQRVRHPLSVLEFVQSPPFGLAQRSSGRITAASHQNSGHPPGMPNWKTP